MCCHMFAGYVHAVSESTLNAAAIDARSTAPVLIARSTVAQMAWRRDPASGGPVNPVVSLSIGTFNARRLWQRDESVHDGFRVLTHILDVWSVSVLCIQEVQAEECPSLPVDQPYHYDGLVGTGGREAAFLVRGGVSGAPTSGVVDTSSVRWRVFDRSWCIVRFMHHVLGFLLASELLSGESSSIGPLTSTALGVCPWSSLEMLKFGTHISGFAPDLAMP